VNPAEPFGSTEENLRHTFAVSAPAQTERFLRTKSFDLLTLVGPLFARNAEKRVSDPVRFVVSLLVRVAYAPACFFESPRLRKSWTVDVFMTGLRSRW
jgi:hypothetical protein